MSIPTAFLVATKLRFTVSRIVDILDPVTFILKLICLVDPNVSAEAKRHAHQVLREHDADVA